MLVSEQELKTLMIRGLEGEAVAQAALLSALVPLLRAFFRRRAGSADEVEDLVQETLIAVHGRRASYDRSRTFTAWLYAIARYKMIDHFRRRHRECHVEGLDEMLIQEGFEDAHVAQMDVQRLLDSLPPKQANAIRDTHIQGLSIAEAATEAGIGESDVKISVHRGLKTLAARIRGVAR